MKVNTFFRVEGEFIPVSKYGLVVPGEEYIEGAIEIIVNHKKILTCEQWDYVDQLWSYFLDGIHDISTGHSFTTYLPDQPIEVSFKLLDTNNVKIQVKNNEIITSSVLRRDLFLKVMLEACRDFFRHLSLVAPGTIDLSNNSLVRIEKIISLI